MNSRGQQLYRQYALTFRRYLDRQEEALLHEAYELGRKAVASGLGVLDVARIHQQATVSCLLARSRSRGRTSDVAAAEAFFLEALSPFEVTHRGFREANLELQQLNAQLRRRNAELATLNGNLLHLSNQILHVQEEERKRISRELHDEVGQALTAINTNLTLVRENAARAPKWVRRRIVEALSLLEQTMDTVHCFARELRPALLDELGLLPALRSYLRSFGERTGLRVRFTACPQAEKLDDEQKTVVFRITQESLTNVAKHAEASQLAVSLRKTGRGIQVRIKDNGKAFEADRQLSVRGEKRLGLLGMQERARLVNGRFAIESARGKGTIVRCEFPFKRSASPATRPPRKASSPPLSKETSHC